MLDFAQIADTLRHIALQLEEAAESKLDEPFDAVRNFVLENGTDEIVTEYRDEIMDVLLNSYEDEVLEQLQSNGSIPDIDLDEVRYAVSRLQDAAADIESACNL